MSDDDLAAIAWPPGRTVAAPSAAGSPTRPSTIARRPTSASHDFPDGGSAERPDDVLSEEGADDRSGWWSAGGSSTAGRRPEFSEPGPMTGRCTWRWQDGELVAGGLPQGVTLATRPWRRCWPRRNTRIWCRRTHLVCPRCRCANGWTAPWSKWVRRGGNRGRGAGLRRCLRPRRRALQWDSAAPVAVAQPLACTPRQLAAGYKPVQPKLPDLVVCRPEYARRCWPSPGSRTRRTPTHSGQNPRHADVAKAEYAVRAMTHWPPWTAAPWSTTEGPGEVAGIRPVPRRHPVPICATTGWCAATAP